MFFPLQRAHSLASSLSMTSNNETVSRQMPWAGDIAKIMTPNRKQFTVTREMLTAVARHLSITWLFVFHPLDLFGLLYNKSLNDWSLGEQWISFPSNLNVSLDLVLGNIEILGKESSPFPSGPDIKCLMFHSRFFLPVPKFTHAHGSIVLPPRHPRVLARLTRWQ